MLVTRSESIYLHSFSPFSVELSQATDYYQSVMFTTENYIGFKPKGMKSPFKKALNT